ncbi:hypothetical protein [Nonomuraea sp. NPDC003214]
MTSATVTRAQLDQELDEQFDPVPPLVRVYCRTFSATTKHIANPDAPRRTLCGHNVQMYGFHTSREHRWMVYDLDTCGRCERAATARGLAEGPEVFRPHAPRVIRRLERGGQAHVEDADSRTITLCGYACGKNAYLDADTGLPACPACAELADRQGYQATAVGDPMAAYHAAVIRDALLAAGRALIADDAAVALVELIVRGSHPDLTPLSKQELTDRARQAIITAESLHTSNLLVSYCEVLDTPVPHWNI